MRSLTGEIQTVDAKTQAKYDARAKIVKAMAHPTRLFIVDELSRRGERCVCDLTEMIGADISTVSKHLSLLKAAGIVEMRSEEIWSSIAWGSPVFRSSSIASNRCCRGMRASADARWPDRRAQKSAHFSRIRYWLIRQLTIQYGSFAFPRRPSITIRAWTSVTESEPTMPAPLYPLLIPVEI